MKVARLVAINLLTRVICEDTDSDVDIANKAKDQLKEQIDNDIHDNVEYIEIDEECPIQPLRGANINP